MSTWLPVVVSIIAAILSAYAATSSAKSAAVAKEANESTEKARTLEAHRKVSKLANEVCAGVDSFAPLVKVNQRRLF